MATNFRVKWAKSAESCSFFVLAFLNDFCDGYITKEMTFDLDIFGTLVHDINIIYITFDGLGLGISSRSQDDKFRCGCNGLIKK